MSNAPLNNPDPNSYPANPGPNAYPAAPAGQAAPGYPNQAAPGSYAANPAPGHHPAPSHTQRRLDETKQAFKTTEFFVFLAVSLAVLIAAAVVDNGDDGQGFGADKAWMYVTFLAVGYMVSRGLAKSGRRSHQRSDD